MEVTGTRRLNRRRQPINGLRRAHSSACEAIEVVRLQQFRTKDLTVVCNWHAQQHDTRGAVLCVNDIIYRNYRILRASVEFHGV